MYNPPDTRDEIRDTLGFLGVSYRYIKLNKSTGHVFQFVLGDASVISINSPYNMTWNSPKIKSKFKNAYELKRSLMATYIE